MAKETKLADVTRLATSHSKHLNGVHLRCTRAATVLDFKISCWIAAVVIRPLLERDGWRVEELE